MANMYGQYQKHKERIIDGLEEEKAELELELEGLEDGDPEIDRLIAEKARVERELIEAESYGYGDYQAEYGDYLYDQMKDEGY